MTIYHIATASDWEAAKRSGQYTTSTLGRSLAEVGFIHAARKDQVRTVFRETYQGSGQDTVLLLIDERRLGVPVVHERVGGSVYPHIQGPIDTDAVKEVLRLDRDGNPPSLRSMVVNDMLVRFGLALMVMALSVTGSVVGGTLLDEDAGTGIGALAGLAVGVVLVWMFYRLRRP